MYRDFSTHNKQAYTGKELVRLYQLMGELMKKIVSRKVIIVIIIIILVIIILYAFGFRITYNPSIITDWAAVGAVGQWGSIAASIFVVYLSAYLSRKFEEKTADIANSNRVKVELISEIEKRMDEKIKVIADKEGNSKTVLGEVDIQKRILSYIEISIVTTTEKIANYIGKPVDETYCLLQKMEVEDQKILHVGDHSNLKREELLWRNK